LFPVAETKSALPVFVTTIEQRTAAAFQIDPKLEIESSRPLFESDGFEAWSTRTIVSPSTSSHSRLRAA
jgi:hypothetical protein